MRHVLLTSVLLLSALLNSTAVDAQSYGLATGLRLGNGTDGRTIGLSGQYRLAKHTTVEGILQTDFGNEHMLHLLIREHQPFLTRRINLYVGAGVSVGQERSLLLSDDELSQRIVDRATMGVDLMAGIEATMVGYSISLDVRPNFNMVGREQWVENEVGVSLRKVVLSGAQVNKRKRQGRRAKKKKERQKERKNRSPWLEEWWQETFKK